MSTIKQLNIPDLGDVDEVEVIEVCVEVGQTVESEDSIMILETDKAAMEIPASVNGTIKKILINVGDMVKQGMPFVEIEVNETSIEENQDIEKRIAITPEIAKKYVSLGFNLILPNNYGTHLGFNDEDYKNLGVNFLDNEEEIIKNSEIVIQLGLPVEEKLSFFKENQTLIGSLNAFVNKEKLENLRKK